MTLRGRKTHTAGSGRRVTVPSRVTGGRGRVVAFLVLSAPDGEQLADDYEELGGGRCAVM